MAAIKPVVDSVPYSLKISRSRLAAALDEKRRTSARGTISPGIPRGLRIFPRRSPIYFKRPEARRTPTAVISPIKVGQIDAIVFKLLEDILRGEWGFEGMVTTDWWTRGEHYKEIKAGNDVKMGTGFPERVKKAMEMGQLGRAELKHCARRVLELILKID